MIDFQYELFYVIKLFFFKASTFPSTCIEMKRLNLDSILTETTCKL